MEIQIKPIRPKTRPLTLRAVATIAAAICAAIGGASVPAGSAYGAAPLSIAGEWFAAPTTVEARANFTEFALCRYSTGAFLGSTALLPWHFGIAVHPADGALITVTDYRAAEHGLFIDGMMKVPGVVGNGVALLDGGRSGAIVTRYGESHPSAFNGIPGALLYIPPQLLA